MWISHLKSSYSPVKNGTTFPSWLFYQVGDSRAIEQLKILGAIGNCRRLVFTVGVYISIHALNKKPVKIGAQSVAEVARY